MSVYPLDAPTDDDIIALLKRALEKDEQLKNTKINVSDNLLETIAHSSGGDVRFALGVLETTVAASSGKDATTELVAEVLGTRQRPTGGEEHYDSLSAFIKSMRGSDADAVVYYLARLLDAGEDPLAIARRIMIAASEDVGLADSRVLTLVTSAAQAIQMCGMPEARIILSHAALAVARAPKSNSAYVAIDAAMAYVKEHPVGEVPHYLRDKVSQAAEMKNPAKKNRLDLTEEELTYKYPHAYGGWVDQRYLPETVEETFYEPSENGAEQHS
jgi:putative ATPase